MKLIEVVTSKITLFGCWYGENFRDTCVIITNGTGGNIFENNFLRAVGDVLEKNNTSFIFAHNSGAFQMIDLQSKNGFKHSGLTYELFDDCVEELQAYVDFAKKAGYKNIVLGGYSYGCNKVVYYLYKSQTKDVNKYIFISPTDMEYHTEGEQKSINEIMPIALEYQKQNRLDEIIPILFDNYNFFTARTFLDFVNNPHHNNLPVYSDKSGFKQLQQIDLQGLYIMGENDPFCKKNALNHLSIINENSKNKNNTIAVIKNCGHAYYKGGEELGRIILEFISK